MKKMSKAEIERRSSNGAKITRPDTKVLPNETKLSDTRVERELSMVKEKLSMVTTQKKRRYVFTVQRDPNGLIERINAEEI